MYVVCRLQNSHGDAARLAAVREQLNAILAEVEQISKVIQTFVKRFEEQGDQQVVSQFQQLLAMPPTGELIQQRRQAVPAQDNKRRPSKKSVTTPSTPAATPGPAAPATPPLPQQGTPQSPSIALSALTAQQIAQRMEQIKLLAQQAQAQGQAQMVQQYAATFEKLKAALPATATATAPTGAPQLAQLHPMQIVQFQQQQQRQLEHMRLLQAQVAGQGPAPMANPMVLQQLQMLQHHQQFQEQLRLMQQQPVCGCGEEKISHYGVQNGLVMKDRLGACAVEDFRAGDGVGGKRGINLSYNQTLILND